MRRLGAALLSMMLDRGQSGARSPHSREARYFFFGGKGGVGKTTAASATALFLLTKLKPNQSILLFSTDPAHSLSDSLDTKIGNRLVEVKQLRGARLIAYEMDASLALERFRAAHGKVLAEIAERGTLLDEEDINELLSLSLPGLDEVMSLFELSELDRAGQYAHIVVDTAPSGHTSRLLRLPEVFDRMVKALDLMGDKHRYIVAHFARRRPVADEVDLFLRDLSQRIESVRKLLHDNEQTRFVLVTIPEAMSVRETERYRELLQEQGVPVRDLIVNRVEEEHEGCEYCHARVESQQPWLKQIATSFRDLKFHYLPLQPNEVRGIDDLKKIGKLIWTDEIKPRITRINRHPKSVSSAAKSSFPLAARKIVIFGGKGGVGKTTAAAAFALALAQANRKQKLLIFSTDPAHSLSDSFDEEIGELKSGVGDVKNLDAMEIDPGKWFEELKQRYRSWTDELFASLSGGSRMEIKFDREAMRELVELTPPGIDEIAALGTISDLLDEEQYDTIILDTAPTGHLIRFLELPQVALSWIRTFMKLLLKYQNVLRATQVAEELVALSKSIKKVIALLTDAERCEFVGVAIPERMSLEETVDLAKSLEKLNVPMGKILINGVVPAEACKFCKSRRKMQDEVIDEYLRRFRGRAIEMFLAPQQPHEIRGAHDLIEHFQAWQKFSRKDAKAQS
ncbi:MAG TPA: ArsA family ATPase [Pyrinomonadaceae bacterium]|nr:ArsA family ATPase [Pyrinomonadaceae bacterium]